MEIVDLKENLPLETNPVSHDVCSLRSQLRRGHTGKGDKIEFNVQTSRMGVWLGTQEGITS